MTVHVGPYEFDQVSYDSDGDVLYLRRGERRAASGGSRPALDAGGCLDPLLAATAR
jgi:hypothetical protein